MTLDGGDGKSPVTGWTAIPLPAEVAQGTLAEKGDPKSTLENTIKYFGENLYQYLLSMGSNQEEDLSDGPEINLRVFSLMNRVRPILEIGASPTEIFRATSRNNKLIVDNVPPIKIGSHLHGLAIEYLDHSHEGVVAGELDSGKKSYNILPLRVYTSYITQDIGSQSLGKFVEQTHTGYYGMKPGTVTLIFDNDGRLGPPKSTYMASKPNSHAVATPLGTPSTEITGCIVFNEEDEKETVEKISRFPFPIPVYNSEGEIIYPPKSKV